MRNRLSLLGVLPLFLALVGSPLGCGSEKDSAVSCPAADEVRGQCAGVPQEPLCDEDSCTAGVDCAEVKAAHDDASLSAARSSATAGTCIALAPGSYGPVTLPAGVSLLGKSAELVSVKGVTVGSGQGSVVRGLTAGSGGVVVEAGAKVLIEAVRVSGAAAAGVQVAEGATVMLLGSAIEGSAGDGVTVADGAVVTIESTIVEGNAGPGLWAACNADCDCVAPPDVAVQSSIVRDNHVGGIVLFGAKAWLSGVDIQGTLVGDDVGFGLGGGGLSVAACSELTATDLRVFQNQAYGILIDDSTALIGDPAGETGVEVDDNQVGVWAQHISQSESQTVTLEGLTVDGNAGVGIGVDGDSVGLIICKSAITGTVLTDVLVEGGGSQQVGDGLLWLGGSEIAVDGLSLSGNARASVVIDGEAGGSMKNVTLSGGDETKGVVQQSYSGGSQPQVGANAPVIATSPTGLFAIPAPPAVLAKSL